MEDGPRLIWLLLAGVLPLMALRGRVRPRVFAALAALYLLVAVVAAAALLAREAPRPPPPADAPLIDV